MVDRLSKITVWIAHYASNYKSRIWIIPVVFYNCRNQQINGTYLTPECQEFNYKTVTKNGLMTFQNSIFAICSEGIQHRSNSELENNAHRLDNVIFLAPSQVLLCVLQHINKMCLIQFTIANTLKKTFWTKYSSWYITFKCLFAALVSRLRVLQKGPEFRSASISRAFKGRAAQGQGTVAPRRMQEVLTFHFSERMS